MKKIFLCVITLMFVANISAQTADVINQVFIEDLAGGENTLLFGLDTLATDGIDPALGESDLPPFPPAGAFEARFFLPNGGFDGTLGSYQDYRQATLPHSGQKEFRLAYQQGAGTVIKITWDFPPDITGLLQDLFGGVLVNQAMSDSGSYTVTNLGINRLKMFITYNNTVPVELTSFSAAVNGSSVVLNWQTATEINNSGFEVERLMSNVWEKIGFVTGAGTTSETRSYSFADENVQAGTYSYRLKQIDFDGSFYYSKAVEAEVGFTPSEYSLNQNYPNPFNPNTSISFSVPSESFVTVKIYNMLGQEITTLFSGNSKAGIHSLNWNGKDSNGTNVSSGNYICKMTSGDFTETRKMNLIK